MALPDGLYDQLLTRSLDELIARGTDENARSLQALNADDAPARLAEVLVAQLAKILDDLEGEGATSCASSWSWSISSSSASASAWGRGGERRHRCRARPILQAIHRQSAPPVPPETGLAAPWLFTAGKGSPALLTELRRELAACDRVDILVSFITHSGVRKLLDVLQAITAVGADGEPRTRIRILTTTYTGATEARALDALAGLPGCEIRVSLDGRRTRLHAKAWLFRRRTGFGSAYVGSANLSGAALMGGLEWTTKFTERGQPELFERACAHFETLWEDSEFQRYDPADRPTAAPSARRCGASRATTSWPARRFSSSPPRPTSRRCSTSCSWSATTAAGATWWWPPPAPARPWWRPSTTGAFASSRAGSRACCSSPTGRRS
jgi:HKD family nuclease